MRERHGDKFLQSVRVGPKGQITVPAEARRMFGIEEGDTLMVLCDPARGIALMKADEFYNMIGGAFPDGGDRDQRA